jgi:hypothetical protein
MPTKFRHLPAIGRTIIVTVAVGVAAIAIVACATSYNAIYRLVGQLDLYGYRTTQGFPLLLDAAFLVAEMAAVLGGIMRVVTRSDEVSQGWPALTMGLCGLGTIGFNVAHAYLIGGRQDPLTVWRCIVAALPPILMILSFQVLIAIVKWVMLHLGRPLTSTAVLSPTGHPAALYGPPGAAYGPPGAAPPGVLNTWGPYGQMPSSTSSENPHNGHANGDGLKRRQIEAYLAQQDSDRLKSVTARELTEELTDTGMDVSERYVARVVDEWTAAQQPAAVRGRRRHK